MYFLYEQYAIGVLTNLKRTFYINKKKIMTVK